MTISFFFFLTFQILVNKICQKIDDIESLNESIWTSLLSVVVKKKVNYKGQLISKCLFGICNSSTFGRIEDTKNTFRN